MKDFSKNYVLLRRGESGEYKVEWEEDRLDTLTLKIMELIQNFSAVNRFLFGGPFKSAEERRRS